MRVRHILMTLLAAAIVLTIAAAPKPVVPPPKRTVLAIQYAGGPAGRFNRYSDGIAPQIVELAHKLNFTDIGHWQPEGWAQVSLTGRVNNYTPTVRQFMIPTSLLCDVSPNFELAWERARKLGMGNLWYDGAASIVQTGTADAPVLRWFSPDDAPLVQKRIATITARYRPDYLFIDDINKLGAWMGQPTGQTWQNPEDVTANRIREGDPPMKRHRNTVPAFAAAVRAGAGDAIVGFEPMTEGFWTDEQLGSPPWMQIVELADLAAFPDATRDDCFLVLNDLNAGYTMNDIRSWIAQVHEKGYHAIVTWWVLKLALLRDGHDDVIPIPVGMIDAQRRAA